MNKKGLITGLIAILGVLFFFAIAALFSNFAWTIFNGEVQNADNETIPSNVKEDIDNLSYFMTWGDKVFVMLFFALFIAYLISSSTLPPDKPIFMLLFLFALIFITVFAMFLSNTWSYLIQLSNFATAAESLTFTSWFILYYPFIAFFTGIAGGIIFYVRRQTDYQTGGGNYGGE